ncbi:MAG: S24 family peptidase [Paraglaciecola polaris]|uniref:LexA family protein n=1 Tax=Paraglaciecola polaris TaxID=222814 RepID=UPI00300144C5
MDTLGARIKARRIELGFKSTSALARALKVSHVTVSAWEKDEYRPDGNNSDNLYTVLKTNSEWLRKGRGDPNAQQMFPVKVSVSDNMANYDLAKPQVNTYPIIGWVQAGAWSSANQEVLADAEYRPAPVPCGDESFILEVRGSSMEPEFYAGDLIFVDPSKQHDNYSFVIALLEDENEATFKQLIIEDGKKYLKAFNPDWPNKFTSINGNCRIIGTVVGKWKKY